MRFEQEGKIATLAPIEPLPASYSRGTSFQALCADTIFRKRQ
jgi:hypothetical protein